MSAAEIALAAGLLVASPGTPFPDIEREEFPNVRAALWKLAIDWELMDRRETSWVLTRIEDLQDDLDLLRRRYINFKGVPLVNDSQRFPERSTINEMLEFNRALRKHIDGRQHLDTDRGAAYREALRETDKLYQVWDAVRDARCEFYYVNVRRQALKKVRDMVGTESYYTGNLPPCIPTWRFQERD
jgi:hypothetical protein